MERLSGEFNRGYTKAIMDIIEIFKYIEPDLKWHHKRINQKLANELLECCLTNRENVRESINGFIRWNNKNNCFEFYEPDRSKTND